MLFRSAKKEIVAKSGNLNPLANTGIFAALKPHSASKWTPLTVTPAGSNQVSFTVPANLSAGVYQLDRKSVG